MDNLNLIDLLAPGLIKSCPELLNRLKGKEFSCGRNRVTVYLKNTVIKLPRGLDGVADNEWEGSISNSEDSYNNPDHIQYPRTRLYYIGVFPILFMERVKHASSKEISNYLGTPTGSGDWTWSVDCGQVGFTRKGRLVAYDYGIM